MKSAKLVREIGFFSAIVLVVANMVGTGIFTTSGFILQELGNPLSMLICWLVGGMFALSGALCYGELGALFPRAGGEYVFLKESFGRCAGFLSGWISLIVGFSAPIAAAAVGFSAYFFRAFTQENLPEISWGWGGLTVVVISPVTLLSVVIIILFSIIHFKGLKFGSRIQNALTLFKVLLIIVFISGAFIGGHGSFQHFESHLDWRLLLSDRFAISLIFISFAYSGWNAAAYLGGEIKNPDRNLPSALLYGTLFVVFIYILLNITFIYALPVERMSGVMEVGAESAVALFGGYWGRLMNGAIAFGLLSVLSVMIMSGPRVYFAMSQDGVFFKLFGSINKTHHTPAHSILLQAVIAIIMVITTSFDKLLLYIGFTLSLFSLLTVMGLIWLRIKHPALPRPYRTFMYPITPVFFIIGNLWIICFSIRTKPITSCLGLGTIALGLLFYLYFVKQDLEKSGNG